MTVMSTVAVSTLPSAAVAVTVCVVRTWVAVGVPVMRQVLATGAIARPVGSAGKIEQPVAAAPVFVNDSGEIATVVA